MSRAKYSMENAYAAALNGALQCASRRCFTSCELAFSVVAILAALLFLINPLQIQAHNLEYGDLPTEYPFGSRGEITAKFVFVSFQDGEEPPTPVGGQNDLFPSIHPNMVQKFINYYEAMSHGELTFSDESGIVFTYVEDGGVWHESDFDYADGDTCAQPWFADQPAQRYKNCFDTDPNICTPEEEYTLPSTYYSKWAAEGIDDWYAPDADRATELVAEILYKIYKNYTDAGVTDFGNVDALIIVTLHNYHGVFSPGVGGRPGVFVDIERVQEETLGFYDGLRRYNNNGNIFGNLQGGGSLFERDENGVVIREIGFTHEFIDNAVRVMCHEFGHALGLTDGPPNLWSGASTVVCEEYPDRWCEERYYYGTLNLMDQHRVRQGPIPPIATPGLTSLPWRSVIDVTGRNEYDIRIRDLMDGGAIYKYRIDPSQYFLVAYRGGVGVDSWVGFNGLTPTRSHGVEIWHVLDSQTWDLESAVKLWAIDETVYRTWLEAIDDTELAEDVVDGYDNYDIWANMFGQYRTTEDYGSYSGDPGEFFAPADSAGDRYPAFSWEGTNPSSKGYSRDPEHEELFGRRRPQDVPSTFEVRIGTLSADGSELSIDLISAPYAPIVDPSGPFSPWDEVTVAWSLSHPSDTETVDLYLLPAANNPEYRVLIASGLTPGQLTADWTVESTTVSPAAALMTRVHNVITDHVGEYISAPFVIDGPPQEFLLPLEEGSDWISGAEYQLRWTAVNGNASYESVAVEYWVAQSASWVEIASGLVEGGLGGYTFNESLGENSYRATPDNSLAGDGGKLRLRFTYYLDGGGTAISYSNEIVDLSVFPVHARFSDVTGNLRGQEYDGLPSCIAPIQADHTLNDSEDLAIAIGSSQSTSRSVVYVNDSGIEPDFDQDTDYFPTVQTLPVGTRGIASADYDNDGDDDLFVCWPEGDGIVSKLLIRDGVDFGETTPEGVNPLSGVSASLLEYVQCCSWIDYDHDGDLDIYLGRGQVVFGPGGEQAIPLRDCLLDNEGGTFTEVGVETGVASLDASTHLFTTCCAWADNDRDGRWDVFVGGTDGAGSRLVNEVSTGLFSVDAAAPFHGMSVSDARWADMDHDGMTDLLTADTSEDVKVYRALGSGSFVATDLAWTSSAAITSLSLIDYDLDGWCEFIVGGATNKVSLVAHTLADQGTTTRFVDISESSGFDNNGVDAAETVFVGDLDSDGDLDAFVARESARVGSLMKNTVRNGGANEPHYLTVVLETSFGSSIYGSTVIVRDASGDLIGTQVVTSRGGKTSQPSRNLVFGLGDYAGGVEVDVYWPTGRIKQVVVPATSLDQKVSVQEPVGFTLDYDSAQFTPGVGVGGETIWFFEWKTDQWTVADFDQVSVTGDPDGCVETSIILQPGDPGVVHSVTYYARTETEASYYLHKLEYYNAPCDPSCEFEYSVGSNNGQWTGLQVSDLKIGKTSKVCPVVQ